MRMVRAAPFRRNMYLGPVFGSADEALKPYAQTKVVSSGVFLFMLVSHILQKGQKLAQSVIRKGQCEP